MFALLAFAGVRAQSNDPTDPSYWDEEKLAAYDAEIAAQYEDVIYMKSSIFPAGSGVVELPINVKSHAPFINVQFRTVMPNGAYPLDEADPLGEMKVIIVPTDRISADALDGKNFTDEGYTQYVSSKMGFCSGDDGVFCSVKLDITGWEAGVYDLVVNSGAILSGFAPDDANGRRQVNDRIVTKLVISDEVILDEESEEYPGTYAGVNVKVLRTISFDNWNTLCLPITMTAEQCKAVFGDNVELAEFTGYDFDEDKSLINVRFKEITSITANRPLIIKIKKTDFPDLDAFTEFKLKGVDIEPVAENVADDELVVESGESAMVGTYVNGTPLFQSGRKGFQYIFLSGNNFYYATADSKPMKGFRAYFDLADADDALTALADGVKFNFSVNDDEPTSIDGISTIEKVADGVYNVSGQKVSESSLEGLPKGVYIVNGKKVFKK